MPTAGGGLHPRDQGPGARLGVRGSPQSPGNERASSSLSTAATRRSTSVLSPRPSLLNTELMCFCTARSVSTSDLAMVALFLPCAICSSTSRSRRVRAPRRGPPAPPLRPPHPPTPPPLPP